MNETERVGVCIVCTHVDLCVWARMCISVCGVRVIQNALF